MVVNANIRYYFITTKYFCKNFGCCLIFFYICSEIIKDMTTIRIKELCKEKGTTLNALADGVDISQPSISLLANGKQKPSYDTLEKLANFFGVNIGELFAPVTDAKIVCPHCGKQITIKTECA